MKIYGYVLVASGILYLIKPDIFRRWFWKKTDIAQRALSPENYLRFMRILGGAFILGGIYCIARG